MDALVLLTTCGVFILGYFMVWKLDLMTGRKPAWENALWEQPKGRYNRGILIYGNTTLIHRFRRGGWRCSELRTADFPEETSFIALLAVSEDDEANLSLCRAAKDSDAKAYILALCTKRGMADSYGEIGVDRVVLPGESLEQIITEVWNV